MLRPGGAGFGGTASSASPSALTEGSLVRANLETDASKSANKLPSCAGDVGEAPRAPPNSSRSLRGPRGWTPWQRARCPEHPLSTAQSGRVASLGFHWAACLVGGDGSHLPVPPKQPFCSSPSRTRAGAAAQSEAFMWPIKEPACICVYMFVSVCM